MPTLNIVLFEDQRHLDRICATHRGRLSSSPVDHVASMSLFKEMISAADRTQLHRPDFRKTGDFASLAELATAVCEGVGVKPAIQPPSRPCQLEAARAYLDAGWAALSDVRRRGYWDWAYADCMRLGKNIIEDHLREVERAWRATQGKSPREQALRLVAMLRERFTLMHDLCEVPRNKNFNYAIALHAAHHAVAGALPDRPPEPGDTAWFLNLVAGLDRLAGLLAPCTPASAQSAALRSAPAGRDALPPAARKALELLEFAQQMQPELGIDRDVFRWLKSRESCPHPLPKKFETWRRNLTTARKALKLSKYTRRAGRDTSGSVVKSDEI